MELLEKAYKTNTNGTIIEEIVVNEVFATWEKFMVRANQFEGYLIVANHDSDICNSKVLNRSGEYVDFTTTDKEIKNIIEFNDYENEIVEFEIIYSTESGEYSTTLLLKRGILESEIIEILESEFDEEVESLVINNLEFDN